MVNDDDQRPGENGGGVIDDEAAAKGGYGERSLPHAESSESARRHAETLESSHSPPPGRATTDAEPGTPAADRDRD